MNTLSPAERATVAHGLGMHEQYLYQVLTNRKTLPAERCPAVERALYPQVTCDKLRPDVSWVRVPDPEWPHPNGRPCIDVAREVAA